MDNPTSSLPSCRVFDFDHDGYHYTMALIDGMLVILDEAEHGGFQPVPADKLTELDQAALRACVSALATGRYFAAR